MLIGNKEIELIGEASDGRELLDLLKVKVPDVAILDIRLPNISGIDLAKILKKEYPKVKVLMLTANTDKHSMKASFRAGVKGFLPKEISGDRFAEAVKTAFEGNMYFTSDSLEEIYHELTNDTQLTESELSSREIDVLRLLAEGLTHKEIAECLHISSRTVESHKKNMLSKLKLDNSVALVRYAIKNGIVNL